MTFEDGPQVHIEAGSIVETDNAVFIGFCIPGYENKKDRNIEIVHVCIHGESERHGRIIFAHDFYTMRDDQARENIFPSYSAIHFYFEFDPVNMKLYQDLINIMDVST